MIFCKLLHPHNTHTFIPTVAFLFPPTQLIPRVSILLKLTLHYNIIQTKFTSPLLEASLSAACFSWMSFNLLSWSCCSLRLSARESCLVWQVYT